MPLGVVAVVFLAACSDSSSPAEPTGLTSVVVASVEVTPATATLTSLGATQQFTPTAKDASGNGISGKTFTWVSTNDGVATVSASGLVTAVSNGSATIRATTDGVTGMASLTVAQQVASVDVTTGRDTLTALGDTTELTAEGKDARGNVVTATFTWTSSDAKVATVDSDGVVTAVANGTATISASSNQPAATNASGNTVGGRSLPRTSPGVGIATIGHSELNAAATDHGLASSRVTAAVIGSVTITVAQAADAPTSTITAAPTSIPSDGASTSTITVQLKDGAGTNLTTGGATVALSTTLGTLGAVTDNGDGTYTATLTAGTAAGTATVTGTLNGTAMTDDAVVTFGPSPATTTITASLTSIPSDGASTSTITVQTKDGAGTNLTTGGATVALSTTLGSLGAVTDNADGTYTATLTAGTAAGTATVTGTLNGTAITDNATVTFGPSPATTTITASPTSILADGASTSTITVQTKDGAGTNLTTGGATVALSTTLGTLGAVTDNADGTYTATLTAGFSAGTATITGTLNGTAITNALAIDVFDPLVLSTSYLVGGYPSTSYSDAIVPATGGDGTYTYSITDGSLPAGLFLNSSTGAITGTTTGSGMSFFEITATSVGLSASALYSITISTQPATGFNLWGMSIASAIPSAAVQAQIDAAFARWEQVVLSDLDAGFFPTLAETDCDGWGTELSSGFVDDVLILVDVAVLGGSIQGQAGRCALVRTSAPFALLGILTLNETVVASLGAQELHDLIWHEVAHVMGIGLDWATLGLVTGSGTGDPRFTGITAAAAWVALGGAGGIWLEIHGGAGSVESHWEESVFDAEIMSAVADPAEAISSMTIASLFDIGWAVNLGAADAYALPGCAPACAGRQARAGPSHRGGPRDVVLVESLLPVDLSPVPVPPRR